MDKKRHIELFLKKEKGNLDASEQAELQQLLQDEETADNAKVFNWSKQYSGGFEPDVDQAWAKFQTKMEDEPQEAIVRPLFPNLIRIAAAVAVLLVAYLFVQPFGKSDEMALLDISTGADEQLTLDLSDGTRILINENSTLQYSDPLIVDGKRKVYLIGEAYFDVERDPDNPFIIESEHTNVKVLGTAFNVRAYPEENFTEVEVVEGKVQFEAKDGSMKEVLVQKEKATCYTNGQSKRAEKTVNAQAWRTGKLIFIDQSFSTILKELERNYNVQINSEQLDIPECKYTFNLNIKETKLEKVLDDLQKTNGIQTKKIGNIYHLIGGYCD